MTTDKQRSGLIILGMHRSGTSALTRVLSLLGYRLPKNVTGKSAGNSTGHWESKLFMQANDDVLEEMGLNWSSWTPLELETLRAKKKLNIIEDFEDKISAEFPGDDDFVLKDPRICRTAPFVFKAFDNKNITPKIIIPIRNPLEVAESLHKRDNMSKEKAAMIWLRYTLDAEFASRGHDRVFTYFEDLLKAPIKTLEHIISALNVTPSKSLKEAKTEIDRFLNGKLKHHSHFKDDVVLDSAMRGWVSRLFFALSEFHNDPSDSNAMAEFDRVKAELDNATPLFEALLDQTFDTQQEKIDKKTEDLSNAEALLEQRDGELSQLTGTLAQRSQDISFLEQEKALLDTEIEDLISKISHRDKTLNTLSQSLFETEQALNKSQASLDASLNEKNKQAEVYEARIEEQIRVYEAQIQEKNAFNEQALRDYQARDTEVKHLRALLAQEQRTVLKPALRRLRSLGGTALRTVLPNNIVDRLAFTVPTSEQKLILETKKREQSTRQASTEHAEVFDTNNKPSKPDIFVFAIIGWHFRTQRPQHIARELSERGHRVFYFEMDPPGAQTEIETINENLLRIKLKLNGVEQIPAYNGVPTADQQKAWLKAFYEFCDTHNATPHKNLIIQHPFWWQLAKLLPPEFYTLYDCMDDIEGFSNSDEALIKLEHELLDECDDMVVSATTLMNKYKRYEPLDLIRNATELEPFLSPNHSLLESKFTIKSKSSSTIKVGYVGAIADWFDTELLRAVARARPDIEFHFCGNISADHPHSLKKEPNIHMYGEIPYIQVPAFLSQMDVVTIPFKIIPIIQACDPVKFYEYSALGKPTVTTPLPELDRAKHLAFFADTPESFIEQIEEAHAKGKDPKFVKELQSFARENTWSDRANQFYNLLNTRPKVSVIILAYGDPSLTNATLKSLKGAGDIYPNMEILIVDNGSSKDNIENMKHYASQFEGVTIIENGENLGFAAGNNVGMEAATGDYVLLLNNDTYVSPGSIEAMLQHLKSTPSIGAVGPLTNNIGNEAKLAIDYSNMAEMIERSRAYKTGYRGKSFETRVVAYFAVMFRRADLETFGLLSPDYGRGMFEDDDHCHLIRSKGFECVVAEDAFIHHHLSATFSQIKEEERKALFEANKAIFEAKWGTWQPHQYREERLTSDLKFDNEDLL